jgi:hypothetical protein
LAELTFVFACGGVVLLCAVLLGQTRVGPTNIKIGALRSGFIVVAATTVLGVLLGVPNAKWPVRTCTVCGRQVLMPPRSDTPICARCRRRFLGAAPMRRERDQGWGVLLIVLAIVVGSVVLYYACGALARSGLSYWIAVPLAILIGAFWWLASFFLPMALIASGLERGLRNTRYTLALARKSAEVNGVEYGSGPITIWSSGPSDSATMVREQLEQGRSRLSSLFGRQIEPRARLRVFCFDRRDSLESYHRQLSLATGNSGGGYVPAPARMVTVSLEGVTSRLMEPENWVRYLTGFYWLEMAKGFLPPFWLREAVAHLLSSSGDGRQLARLNRRMLASIRRARTLESALLFQVKEQALVKPAQSWADHDSFMKLSQWSPQSWSVGEYLFGGDSTEDRRARSVGFLKDLKPDERQEAEFERHFGHGFDRLLDDWRDWVLEHGEGTHAPPPPAIRDALNRELIPTIQNRQAPLLDRTHAVRIMGGEGYAAGADTLIDLVRTGSEIPREELVWALESISGLTLGDDADAWTNWWQSLPETAK